MTYFLSNQYEVDRNIRKKELEFVDVYAQLVKVMWEDNCTIEPERFKNTLAKFYDSYSGYRQHDASEAFIKIIELLHEGLSYRANIRAIETGGKLNYYDKINIMSIEAWKKRYSTNFSIPLKMFHGQFWSRKKCENCGQVSHNFDPFSIINLPISEKTNTIWDCINYYILSEELEGIDCEFCKKKSRSMKKTTVWKTPPVLVFCFNRFDESGNKISKLIDFPINRVNFSDLVDKPSEKKALFDLTAIANHSGNLGGGHFWAYAKNMEGKWHNFNDKNVSEIDDTSYLVTSNAYYLIYVKRGLSVDVIYS